METTAAGAATIMSGWPGQEKSPYEASGMGPVGLVVGNSSEYWVNGLSKLITDHDCRNGLHRLNFEFLRKSWSWQGCEAKREQWKQAFMCLAGG